MSHPAWVCGLKQSWNSLHTKLIKVTPCVGVWIETEYPLPGFIKMEVTPCVGVWIETLSPAICLPSMRSHTLRGCVD